MSEFVSFKRKFIEGCAAHLEWLGDPISTARAGELRAVLAQEAGHVEEPLGIVDRVAVGVEGMPQYLIMFDDAERPVETMFGEEIARKRYTDISMSWNAHLFVKIDSNSRDAMFAKNNAAVVTSPPAPVSVVFPSNEEVSLLVWEVHLKMQSIPGISVFNAAEISAATLMEKIKELNS